MVRVVVGFRLGCELVLELVLELRLGVQLSTRACNSNLKLTRTPIPNPPYRLVLQRTLWMSAGSARTLGAGRYAFQAGDSHVNVPHFFDTNALQLCQSLGLLTYACKTGSSTAIKLAPRMHQNLPY